MIQTSETFKPLLDTAPGKLHLLLADGTWVPPAAVKSAEWSGGSNSGDDITLGSTVAARLKVLLDRAELAGLDLADARITASLTLEGAVDEIPWGILQVDSIDGDDDTVEISAADAMLWAFNTQYALDDATLGFDWSAGVDGEVLLQAICEACGVTLGTTGLPEIKLTNVDATGYTYREVIAFLACMWGRFARIDGRGQLVLQWYTAADRPIAPDRYYDGELVKADYIYTIRYIKCYVEPLEETLTVGDPTQAQGIYIQCPWMTPEYLQAVWEAVGGFNYRPVSELGFLGDPRLEPGDVVEVTDRDGLFHTVPCMTLRHEFDGGLISTITAVGKSQSASEHDYMGPVTRQIERAAANIKATLIKYQDRIEARVETTEGDITQLQQTSDQIQARVEDNEGAITDLQLNAAGLEARVEGTEEDVAALKMTAGQVSLTVSTQDGTLSTTIDAKTWEAIYKTLSGDVASGFYFDFALGRFVYDGTGVFRSEDGTSYIQINNDGLSLFADSGAGEVVEKLRVGFTSSGGVDYPYILLGSGDNAGYSGLIKKFYDGLFLGNAYALNAAGNFEPQSNYAGIFVDTLNGKTYVVEGPNKRNVYTGEAIAKFK